MKYILAALAGLWVSTASVAYVAPTQLPPALLFSDKPINSGCFEFFEGSSEIDLKTCTLKDDKSIVKKQNPDRIKKGFIGFESQDANGISRWDYYKVFDAGNGYYWIYVDFSGGGSGTFTSIQLVKRKNAETLEIQDIQGGDHGYHGIDDVKEQDHQLSFSVKMQAGDLATGEFMPGYKNPNKLDGTEFLSSPTGPMFKAFYELDAKDPAKPRLKYIDLLGDKKDVDANKAQQYLKAAQQGASIRDCLNNFALFYQGQGKSKLNVEEANQFLKKFNEICVKEEKHGTD
jgi:hypothetical protein